MSYSNEYSGAKTGADDYTRAMLGLLGERDPIPLLESGANNIEDAVRQISSEKLDIPEAEGKWSIVDVVRHLAETEMVYGYRIRLVLSHDTPEIEGFDQDRWSRLVRHEGATIDDYLSMLEILREMNLKVYRGLSETDLHKFGVHSERGPESVGRMIKLCAAHDEVHLAQIRRIAGGI